MKMTYDDGDVFGGEKFDGDELLLPEKNPKAPEDLFLFDGLDSNLKLKAQTLAENLRTFSAPNLLKLLPLYADESGEIEIQHSQFKEGEEYRAARKEALLFQYLARINNLQSRWQNFQTMEEGILAVMMVPLRQLDLDNVRALAYGRNKTFRSEFVEAEMRGLEKDFGEEYVAKIISRIKDNNPHFEPSGKEKNDTHLIVLALMILRLSKNKDIHDLCVDVFCAKALDIVNTMLSFFKYAKSNNNQRALEVLAWITDCDVDSIERKLEKLKKPDAYEEKMYASNKAYRRWFRLLTVPGSLDRAVELNELSPAILFAISRYSSSSNPLLWSCALVFGWERAWDLCKTIQSHADMLMRMDKVNDLEITYDQSPQGFIPANSFLNHKSLLVDGYITGPCFANFRGISYEVGQTRIERSLFSVIDHPGKRLKLVYQFGDISVLGKFSFAPLRGHVIKDSLLADIDQLGGKLEDTSLQSVIISNMRCRGAIIYSCSFKNVMFNNSNFVKTFFSYGTFDHCHFTSTVHFERCGFGLPPSMANHHSDTNLTSVFYQCKFECDELSQMENIKKARFINCEFKPGFQLSKDMICYNTSDKSLSTIESLYELFNQLREAHDDDFIFTYLQGRNGRLGVVLESYKRSSITKQQDELLREMFGHQSNPITRTLAVWTGIRIGNTSLEFYESECNKLGISVLDSPANAKPKIEKTGWFG